MVSRFSCSSFRTNHSGAQGETVRRIEVQRTTSQDLGGTCPKGQWPKGQYGRYYKKQILGQWLLGQGHE
jgi:hypothetical protein